MGFAAGKGVWIGSAYTFSVLVLLRWWFRTRGTKQTENTEVADETIAEVADESTSEVGNENTEVTAAEVGNENAEAADESTSEVGNENTSEIGDGGRTSRLVVVVLKIVAELHNSMLLHHLV